MYGVGIKDSGIPGRTQGDLADASATELLVLFRSKKASPVEALQSVLDRISALNPMVNAFAHLDPGRALSDAKASENRWMSGQATGALDGVPACLKDLLPVKGWPTLRGSRALDPQQSWHEDCPAASRLKEQGAIIVGKTTTSEFGWKAITDNPLTGITRNPWDLSRTPGGSSGGAAVAAALGFAPLHVATDGAGSIRQPSALTGVFGFKPTGGLVAHYPVAHTGTLFHVGSITRTVGDATLLLKVIGQTDSRDQAAVPAPFLWGDDQDKACAGIRIGLSPTLGYAEVDPEIQETVAKAVHALHASGALIHQVEGCLDDPHPTLDVLLSSSIHWMIKRLPADRSFLIEDGLRAVGQAGAAISAETYLDAVNARRLFTEQVDRMFHGIDILVTPSTTQTALDAEPALSAENALLARSPFAYPFNLTTQPACSVPCGFTGKGLPVGLQIVGRRFADNLVLRVARSLERIRPFQLPVLDVSIRSTFSGAALNSDP